MSLGTTHPSLYMRLSQDSPPDFWDLALRYVLEGQNRAQLFNDDAIIPAMVGDGIALEDARDYTTGGCMECAPQGKIGDYLYIGTYNCVKPLEYVLTGGYDLMDGARVAPLDGDATAYPTFDALWAAYEAELRRELDLELSRMDVLMRTSQVYRPMLLMSSMVHDCRERGRAINDGGARYGHYGLGATGLPNAGDSLYALWCAVYRDRVCTAAELLQALRDNFAGHERLRAYLRGLPRYGQDNPEPDAMVDRVLRAFNAAIKSHVNPVGDICRPVILSFVWTVTMGAVTGATPDGRLAGQPFAQSLSPQSGSLTRGTTAALNSATRLSLHEVSGAGSMMWDLDPQWARPEWLEPLIRTYFAQGGHIFQGNTMDPERLRDAQRDPRPPPRPYRPRRRLLGHVPVAESRNPGGDHLSLPPRRVGCAAPSP